MVPIGAILTDWWNLSPLGVLFHTTRSSSEDLVPWTYGDSDLLTLPTIHFLALLKCVDCSSAINHPSSNSDHFIGRTWPWSLSSLTGCHPTLIIFIGQTWPLSLSSLTGCHPTLIIFIGQTWPWSLRSLTVSALSRFLYLGLCFSQHSIIYYEDNKKLHCDTGWSLCLDSNPNIFPSQVRASAMPTIWNWSDLKSFLIFIIKPTCVE